MFNHVNDMNQALSVLVLKDVFDGDDNREQGARKNPIRLDNKNQPTARSSSWASSDSCRI